MRSKYPDISEFLNPQKGDIASGMVKQKTRERCLYIFMPCLNCQKPRWIQKSSYKAGNQGDICHACSMILKNSGKNHPRWKDRQIRKGGYIDRHLEKDHPFYSMAKRDGRIPEHRLVMAESLGRALSKEELVHHINGNKQDNRPENLRLETRQRHDLQSHFNGLTKRIEFLERSNLILWILFLRSHSQWSKV